jgi:cytochrome c5
VVVPAEAAAPEFCRVLGQVAPEVRFEVSLPAAWNGRLYMFGNGGFAGESFTAPNRVPRRNAALAKGFAVAQTNTGHDADKEPLASFASSPQKLVDYAFRAVVEQYCMVCHNGELKTAGLELDKANFDTPPADAPVFEKVIRKVRTGEMPPGAVRVREELAELFGDPFRADHHVLPAQRECFVETNPRPARLHHARRDGSDSWSRWTLKTRKPPI